MGSPKEYNTKINRHILENLVYQTWLCRYPRPTIIMYDCRNELLGRAIKNDLIKTNNKLSLIVEIREIHKQTTHWNLFAK